MTESKKLKFAVVGLGKMGISHHSMVNAHPDVDLVAICDSTKFVIDVLGKYTGTPTYDDYYRMLEQVPLDAVVIATPSKTHADMVRAALDKGIHVFCEKPFTLDPDESAALSDLADQKGLVTQVGYHNRFVGAFGEVKRLLDLGAIGTVTHALGEAYGPVVLKSRGSTWRSQRDAGGGCLYDYAAHPLHLLNWYLGEPTAVRGTILKPIFSRDLDDEVFTTLMYPDGRTAQLSANWSDESQRKMTTRVTIWGTAGRIFADRQEVQVYLRDTAPVPAGYERGWNVRYTTDLTDPVWFYLRGEEYSAQIDAFVQGIAEGRTGGANEFRSAALTDRVVSMMLADAATEGSTTAVRAARPAGGFSRRKRVRPVVERFRQLTSSKGSA